jgi:hypothetical protein
MIVCLITTLIQFVFGFVIPIYGSLRLLSSKGSLSPNDAARWLTYWITLVVILNIFPYLNYFEIEFLDTLLSILKTALIVFLVLPQTDGSSIIHSKLIANKEIIKNLQEKVKGHAKPLVEKVSGFFKA